MSGLKETYIPLNAVQILVRLEQLEQAQLASGAALAPAITGPLGVRIFSASSPDKVLAAIPDNPRRSTNPFSY